MHRQARHVRTPDGLDGLLLAGLGLAHLDVRDSGECGKERVRVLFFSKGSTRKAFSILLPKITRLSISDWNAEFDSVNFCTVHLPCWYKI